MQLLPQTASRWALKTLSSTTRNSRGLPFICATCRTLQHKQSSRQPQHRPFSSNPIFRDDDTASAQTKSTTPPPPPSSGYARLTTRRLISISGRDAPTFLQGLTTTGIIGGTESNYCGFLNALGRVLHDVYIYNVPGGLGDPEFLIEVDAAQATTLLKHLKRYKLRSQISVRAVGEDEMGVWQVWGHEINNSAIAREESGNGNNIVIPDLRAPGMGYRVLNIGGGTDLSLPNLNNMDLSPSDESAYRIRRYLLGVPEGSAEIPSGNALPQESNMDLMGGIDFRKGCYVGQELTIRTRHRGVVRKRIIPCILYDNNDSRPPTSLEYSPSSITSQLRGGMTIGRLGKKGRSTGTYLAGVGNIGLALCRVQIMSDLVVPNDSGSSLEFDPRAEFVVKDKEKEGEGKGEEKEGPGVKIKAFVPEWLRKRLDEDVVVGGGGGKQH
ncbi:Aminomethyltransferase folate-binding domain-containing protein [Poronia punctata]|nr:Aminomethyltransferase folate-binding domain-containing protein [Poronia punctata]